MDNVTSENELAIDCHTYVQLGQVLVEALAARAALAAGLNGPPNFTWDKALHAWTYSLVVALTGLQIGQYDSRMTFMKVWKTSSSLPDLVLICPVSSNRANTL